MADYRRLVSYMYNYENGVKGSNVGYARVESRSGQCRVYIRIKVASVNDDELKVYFFKRNGYSIEGIQLGMLSVKNGLGQFRTLTDSNNIMGSTYELDDIGGIVLYHTDKKYFATEWDDKPVTREMVNTSLLMPLEIVKDHKENEELVTAADDIEKKELTDEEITKKVELTDEEIIKKVEVIKENTGQVEEAVKKEKLRTEEKMSQQELEKDDIEKDVIENVESLIKNTKTVAVDVAEESEETADTAETAETVDSSSINTSKESSYNRRKRKPWPAFEEHPDALKIYDKYPKMYPFEDNEVAWCVRFEPQNIGALPMDNWSLGNNSFLLHGFYCYSHLIFARINDKSGIQYILGVPGIYHNRERFMAKMFGFDFFKSIKRKELRTGEFGYWYTPIYFN